MAEGVTNDVVENGQENEIQAEEVQPEENIVPDTPLPEEGTEEGQVDSEVTVPDSEPVIGENGGVVESEPVEEAEKEEVLEEAMATLSDEGEEEIPEITDEDLLRNQNSRYENRVNHDDVCRGGGNTNNTDKPNQDPGTSKVYWDYNDSTFNQVFSERELIDMFWPKRGGDAPNHGYRLPDAVIDPEYQCFYANRENGFGESVGQSEWTPDYYYKYNKDWVMQWGEKWTPRPAGSQRNPNTGKPISIPNYKDLKYAGNYRWQNGRGGYLFTIVTRPKLRVGLHGHYFDPNTGQQIGQYYIGGNSHPRVYDTTGTREWEHDPKTSMYKFVGKTNGEVYYSKPGYPGFNGTTPYRGTPTKPGRYSMTIQVKEDLNQFILPGRWEEEVIYMNKGYRTKFVQTIDGGREENITESHWNEGDKPDPFDEETKRLFDIDYYLQGKSYKIPVPKYDANTYIFEGWTVEEEYWEGPSIGYPNGKIKRKLTDLTKTNNGNYTYTPSEIGADQYFVLEAKLVAKLRTRKTNNLNTQLNFINDESGLQLDQKASITGTSIKLVEGILNSTQVEVTLQDLPFDFVGYTRDQEGKQVLSNGKQWNPWNDFKPDNQSELHKQTTVYATVTAKPITIKLDPNLDQLPKATSVDTTVINTHYYKQPQIHTHSITNGEFALLGWAETPDGPVKVLNGGTYQVKPEKVNGVYPGEKTLYAKWGRATAIVHAEKYKDTLMYKTVDSALAANNIYTDGTTEINAYELGRFYLKVKPSGDDSINGQFKPEASKFRVVVERSQDRHKWEKLALDNVSSEAIVTKAFGKKGGPYAKVVYDKQKDQWFVPLLGLATKMNNSDSYKGFYRVAVAYEDDKAPIRVSTEEEYMNGKMVGWTKSDLLEVKAVEGPETYINVPSSITIKDKKEVSPDGTVNEIIESVQKSYQVKQKSFKHTESQKNDYDWGTPNNALVNKGDRTYNDQHLEFITPKDFYVGLAWNGVLQDSTGNYTVNNIKIYSAQNLGAMKENQEIASNTKRAFKYDGSHSDKVLFDFYLKGDKPKGLPEGLQLKGTITFTVSPVAQ